MPAPPLRQLASRIYSDPHIAFDVEQIHIIEDRGGLPSSYQTKVGFVDFCGSMTRSRCRRLLSGHWRQKPGSGCNVKNKEVVEELMEVASTENIENIRLCKVDHCMAGSRGWDRYWSLFIVKDLVPHLSCEVKEVHIIEKVCEIGTSHNPHLLARRVSLLNYFKSYSWAGPWL